MRRLPPLLPLLFVLTLAVTAADHWTTWVCLREPVPGWHVTEANPIAAWLFSAIGLVPAILLDSAVTVLALAWLVQSALVPHLLKHAFLVCVVSWTSWAVMNNVQAILLMGIRPFGGA
jgi:hypothetical protein